MLKQYIFPLDNVLAIIKLLRAIAVMGSTLGAFLIGIGGSVSLLGLEAINPYKITLLFFIGIVLHGIACHSFNDVYDWKSGTDKENRGLLSGGSGVIKEGILGQQKVLFVGTLALAVGITAGLIIVLVTGIKFLFFLSIGIFSSYFYTAPPLRLAYRPFLGEWVGEFPAILAVTLGTSYVLAGGITASTFWAGFLHALFCVAWLMQHHIPDILPDLNSFPRKVTTVGLFYLTWGIQSTRWPSIIYHVLIFLIAFLLTNFYKSIFLISLLLALAGIFLAYTTDPQDKDDVSLKLKGMLLLNIVHGITMAFFLAFNT